MSKSIQEKIAQSDYTVPGTDHTPGSGGEPLTERARHAMETAKRRASDSFGHFRHQASHAYEDGVGAVRASLQERPLTFGLTAFAAGVLVGILIPSLRSEQRHGSRRAAERARYKGSEYADLVRAKGKEYADLARSKGLKHAEEARAKGQEFASRGREFATRGDEAVSKATDEAERSVRQSEPFK